MTQQKFASLPYEVEVKARRFEGQVAMIHGGAQGLGRVAGRRLALEGAKVVIADLQAEQGSKTAEELSAETAMECAAYAGDLSVEGVAEKMVAEVTERFGRIDVLVNTAAYQMRKPLLSFTEEMLQRAVDWNMWNILRACKAVLPGMMERKYGRIVNVGGSAFEKGSPYHALLAGVGKGSIVGLTTTIAGEFINHGITANCVSPMAMDVQADGIIDSKAGGRSPEFNPTDEEKEIYGPRGGGGGLPMGRPAHPTEVVSAIAFFASPEASYITGQLLSVTGGAHML